MMGSIGPWVSRKNYWSSQGAAGRVTTEGERYARVTDAFGQSARDVLTCGCHVHVSVAAVDEERVSDGVAALLSRGIGADLQRRVHQDAGDLTAVVRAAIAATTEGDSRATVTASS